MIDGTKPGFNRAVKVIGWRFKYFGVMAGVVRTELGNRTIATPVVSLARLPMENGPTVVVLATSVSLWKYNFHAELSFIVGAVDPVKHAAAMQQILQHNSAVQQIAKKLNLKQAPSDDGTILSGGDPVAGDQNVTN